MCVNLPVKITKELGNKVFVQVGARKKEVSGSLVKVRKGDYVYLKNNFIIEKINKKEAEQIINLVNDNYLWE